jgi:hypothetical protein
LQPFFAAQGLHGLQPFLAAHGLQGLQPRFLAAQGLHGLQPFLGAQGLHGLQGLLAQAACSRGTTHFLETAPPLAPQGLHGLQPFAAQGLQGLQPLAAHGLQGLQPLFFAPQGLQGLQPLLAAHGLHGRHAASWMGRGLGLATGNKICCSIPTLAAPTGVAGVNAPPTAIPAPRNAGMTVVDRSENLNDLTMASCSRMFADLVLVRIY